jgi:protease I
MRTLDGLRVAILVENGFEQSELLKPREFLEAAGAHTQIVSPQAEQVRGWNHGDWGDALPVDVPLERAHTADFDALLLPGGVINPDRLRMNEAAVTFAKSFVIERKPVAAICHGPWMLVEADVLDGRRLTSYHSIRTDVINAGGDWVDEAVVVDGNLITSRKPDDLPDFIDKTMEAIDQRAEIATAGA